MPGYVCLQRNLTGTAQERGTNGFLTPGTFTVDDRL